MSAVEANCPLQPGPARTKSSNIERGTDYLSPARYLKAGHKRRLDRRQRPNDRHGFYPPSYPHDRTPPARRITRAAFANQVYSNVEARTRAGWTDRSPGGPQQRALDVRQAVAGPLPRRAYLGGSRT